MNKDYIRQAAREMAAAVEALDDTCEKINEVAQIMEDTVHGDRAASILNDLEDIMCDLRQIRNMLDEEGRE